MRKPRHREHYTGQGHHTGRGQQSGLDSRISPSLSQLRSGRASWAASSTTLLPAGKVGSLCPLTGQQGQGPHSLSTEELRLPPGSMRPTCPHWGPGRHSTWKPELPLARACIWASCLSQELFLRSLTPLREDREDGGLPLPGCSGAHVTAPFTVSSPALSFHSGFFIPRTDLAHQVPALPCTEESEKQANCIHLTVSQPEKPAEGKTMFADRVRSKVTP